MAVRGVDNSRLVNSSVHIAAGHGLLGGGQFVLGGDAAAGFSIDGDIVPDLRVPNQFAAPLTILDTTPAVSQTHGALVVVGGVAIGGDLFTRATYNMSDRRVVQAASKK